MLLHGWGGECALSTTQSHGFEMTTAVLLLLLLPTLVASESCGSGDETKPLRMLGRFDLVQAPDQISLLSRKSGHKGNGAWLWPTAGRRETHGSGLVLPKFT